MHPLDLLKTRFQLSSKRLRVVSHLGTIARERRPALATTATAATAMTTAVTSAAVNPLRLWRGSFPAVAMQAPRGALKFSINAASTSWLEKTQYQHFVAGGITGITESVVITPFELIKVRLQAQDKLAAYTNSYHALRTIINKEGVASLWRGLESTLWRNGSWNAAYFGSIDVVRKRVHHWLEPYTTPEIRHFVAGTIGGSIGACFSTPIDVAKSRIQNTIIASSSSSSSLSKSLVPWTIPSVIAIGKQEGILGLYRGFVPKLLRLGPGGGLLLVTFETTQKYVEQKMHF